MGNFGRFWRVGVVSFCVIVVVASVARRQTGDIAWSTAVNIAGNSDVSTNGTLLYAYNFGSDSGPTTAEPTLINGVPFGAYAVPDGSSAISNSNFTVQGFSGQAMTGSLNFGTGAGTYAGLSASYKTMLGTGVAKTSGVPFLDLTLRNLTPGTTYQVQLWVNDSSLAAGSGSAPRSIFNFSGNNPAPIDANTSDAANGTGQYVVGTFVADNAQQVLFDHGDFGGTGGAVLNGLQVRAVPEPATFGILAGIGMLATQKNRRRDSR